MANCSQYGKRSAARIALAALLAGVLALPACAADTLYTAATVAMDTVVEQTAYGPAAQAAMRDVNLALAAFEDEFSLFSVEGDIARVNAGAGSWVDVAPETAALLRQAQALSARGEGAFAFTIAPLTLAWGVTSGAPRVPSNEELAALLPLVDDAAVEIEDARVRLPRPGMGIDLGGIAKGAACGVAAGIYERHGVESAWLSIGGNIYTRGRKPGGKRFTFGFADPNRRGGAYMAFFELEDATVAVSGGYERYFEADGERYIHILDPRTGRPAESDLVSVGVVSADGAEADFWSTTLYVQGVAGALSYMRDGGAALALAEDGTLYVSECLAEGLELTDTSYRLEFVPAEGDNAAGQ